MNVIDCDRILVIKPSSLGDIVHTIPAVLAIHRTVLGVPIDWVVNTEWAPLLEGLPFLDRVIRFPRKEFKGIGGITAANQWANRELRSDEPPLAMDFQGLLRSGWLAWKSRPECTVGFQNTREGAHFFYHLKVLVENWETTHAVDRYMALAKACGVKEDAAVDFELPQGEDIGGLKLPENQPWILIHPFSRGTGKSLSQAEVADFCRAVAPVPVVIAGAGAPEFPENFLPENAYDLLGKTSIGQLISLIRAASWTVSVDSGPMHLAAAISEKILSIHTWSDPKIVGPYPRNAWIWRDGRIIQQKEITAGEFPERRDLRKQFSESPRLLPEDGIPQLADFVKTRLLPSR